jgi:hypothetical protein
MRPPHPTVRWRPRNNREVWLRVLALNVALCLVGVAVPAERRLLPGMIIASVAATWLGTESRLQRREREELAARLAALSDGDLPADVISLVAAGNPSNAQTRYGPQRLVAE